MKSIHKYIIIFFIWQIHIFVGDLYAQKIKIHEHCKVLKVLAVVTLNEDYAVTIGKNIYISCSKRDFFSNRLWLRHEMYHVQQYEKLGIPKFFGNYIINIVLFGVKDNPMEQHFKEPKYETYFH